MRTIDQILEDLQAIRVVDVEVYRLPAQDGARDGAAARARACRATCGSLTMPIAWEEYLALKDAGALQVSAPRQAQSS